MKQLYQLIDQVKENSDTARNEEKKVLAEEDVAEEELVSLVISLNALARIPSLDNYNKIRASGYVKGYKIHILVDSGTTQLP